MEIARKEDSQATESEVYSFGVLGDGERRNALAMCTPQSFNMTSER
jgi:hypothetical protein